MLESVVALEGWEWGSFPCMIINRKCTIYVYKTVFTSTKPRVSVFITCVLTTDHDLLENKLESLQWLLENC